MKHQLIIIRYGEIGLKSKTTRKHFENILIKNIKNAFKKEKIFNVIKTQMGRIYVYTDEINPAVKVLQKIFGITSVSPAICLLYTSPSPRDLSTSRMPSSA